MGEGGRDAIRPGPRGGGGDPATRRRVRRTAQTELARLCQPWLAPRVAQTPLCASILTHLPSLFVFVTEPGVPPTNNAAERSLRNLVVIRKISGGDPFCPWHRDPDDARLPSSLNSFMLPTPIDITAPYG